jgi:hypothetical protein
MFDEHAELLERAFVENQVDPLARRQLAALVLRIDPRLPAALAGDLAATLELFENVLHRLPPPPGKTLIIRNQRSA